MSKNEAFLAFFEAKMGCFFAVFGVFGAINVSEMG